MWNDHLDAGFARGRPLLSRKTTQRGYSFFPPLLMLFAFFGLTGIGTIAVLLYMVQCLSNDVTKKKGLAMVWCGIAGIALAFMSLHRVFHNAQFNNWSIATVSLLLGFPAGALLPVMADTWKRLRTF